MSFDSTRRDSIGAGPDFSRLDQAANAIDGAIGAADAMFTVRSDADDTRLRVLRDRLAPLAKSAANHTISEQRLLEMLSDVGNEWLELEDHVDDSPSGVEEFGRRNNVFNRILEARDPLKF